MTGIILTKAMRGRIALEKRLRAQSKNNVAPFRDSFGSPCALAAALDNITGQT